MKITHTFFWKVNELNGYLSQWYKSSFTINDIEYNCAEQYMMHQKALGRLVKNFNVAIWDSKCEEIPALFTVKVDEQYFKAGPDIIVIWPMTTQPPKDSILI